MKNSIRDNSYRLESVEQSLNESNKELESKVDKQIGLCVVGNKFVAFGVGYGFLMGNS